MNKNVFILLTMLSSSLAFSQVGIGTANPDSSAILHLESNNKGFLPPKVALTSSEDAATIPNPATGLLIYNTATDGVAPINVVPGLMINTGTSVSPIWSAVNVNSNGGAVGVSAISSRGNGTNGDLSVTMDNLIFSVGDSSGAVVPYVQTISGTAIIYFSATGIWDFNGTTTTSIYTSTTPINISSARVKLARAGWNWFHVGDTQTTFITNSSTRSVYRVTTMTAPLAIDMLLTVEKLY